MYIDIISAEDALARLWRMRLAIDLPIAQIHLIRIVRLQIELSIARQTLKTRLVINIALNGPDPLQRVHLIAASQAFIVRPAASSAIHAALVEIEGRLRHAHVGEVVGDAVHVVASVRAV